MAGDKQEIHGSREAIARVTGELHIYFTSSIAIIGGLLFLIGLFSVPHLNENPLKDVPGYLVMIPLGLLAFSMFFSWFLVLFVSRHFLLSIKRLEYRIDQMEALVQKEKPAAT